MPFWVTDSLYCDDSSYESNCEMKEKAIEEYEFYCKYGYYPNNKGHE